MSEPILLPCPFCGEPATLTNVRMSNHSFGVHCSNETCWKERTSFHPTAEKAAAVWNTRADAPTPSEPAPAQILDGVFDHKAGCRAPDYGPCTCKPAPAEPAAPAELDIPALIAERDKYRAALVKIDEIRDSMIGYQNFSISAHGYPIVAALGEAGFAGVGYEVASKMAQTQVDLIAKLRERIAALESERSWRDIETAPKDGWFLISTEVFGVVVGRRSKDPDYDWEFFDDSYIGTERTLNACDEATAWQPLPEPPRPATDPPTSHHPSRSS